ncbi:MAG: DoxX family protein, partial [Geminicoccaceae bacterium]
MSGIQKLSNWDSALYLATYEYPVSWLSPVTSAYVGVAVEFLCPIFLALGLATRAAALPMLILSLVIHVEYQQLNSQVYWAVLLGWYVVMGAGALSLDRLLGRGLADSALPLTGAISELFERMSDGLGPLYLLFVRCWLALLLFVSGMTSPDDRAAVWSLFGYQYQVQIPA